MKPRSLYYKLKYATGGLLEDPTNTNTSSPSLTPAPSSRKKVLAFVEAPKLSSDINDFYNVPNDIPGYQDLKKIKKEYESTYNKKQNRWNEIQQESDKFVPTLEETDAFWRSKHDVDSYLKGYFGNDDYSTTNALRKDSVNLGEYEDYDALPKKYRDAYNKNDSIISSKYKASNDYRRSQTNKYEHQVDSITNVYSTLATKLFGTKTYDKFIKEGQNVKDFYKKTDPNVDVEIVPSFENLDEIKDKVKNLKSQDDIALFFHHGSRAFGIPQDSIVDALSKTKAGKVYLATCFSEDLVKENYSKLKGKEVYYRPGSPHWGFDPTAKDFLSGMFGRTSQDEHNPENKDKFGVGIAPLQKGKTYDVKKFESGGNIMGSKTKSLKRKKLMAGGGPTGDPKRPKAGTAYSVVSNNILHPLTDLNIADEIIQRGWGTNRDSIMSLTPEARQSMVPKGSDITFERKRKAPYGTANQGGYKAYKSIPKVIGRTLQIPGRTIDNPTADVLGEWGYGNGGNLDQYSFGGWLKDNIGDIAKTAIGGAMVASGVGAPIGMGLIGSGASGMIGSIGQPASDENEISKVYQPAVSKNRQLYDTAVAEGGMNLKRLSKRTDYVGEKHAQGGINLNMGGNDVQVEDGETRTGDMVHSEKIKITPGIMKAYGGKVPIKKRDIGKSVSSLVKRSDKRFEKRSGDEWNDKARKVSQLPFEEMSDELSQMYEKGEMMAGGGELATDPSLWDKTKGFLNDSGNAPIIGSALGLITNTLRKPEKVKYDQAKFTPTNFTPMNTEAGIGAIKRSYGDTKERLRRLNPRGYMNQLANLGASEAETISDSVSRIGLGNTQGMNQASMMDSQNRSRLSMFNSQVAMQEAEANAQNRAMRKTAIDANMNQMFTQIGQKERDTKLDAAQKDYQDNMFKIQKGYQDIMRDQSKKEPYDFSIPGDKVLNPFNPIEEDSNKMYGKFGGSIIPKTTALLSKRRYRTY